jgi:hypothetical protein
LGQGREACLLHGCLPHGCGHVQACRGGQAVWRQRLLVMCPQGRGLAASGRKAELAERLRRALE